MGVGDGDGERVGGVGAVGGRARQEAPHHGADLALVAMACADHGLLDGVGRIFGDDDARKRRHEQGDPARLAELERCRSVTVDESLLDRGLRRRKLREHL